MLCTATKLANDVDKKHMLASSHKTCDMCMYQENIC